MLLQSPALSTPAQSGAHLPEWDEKCIGQQPEHRRWTWSNRMTKHESLSKLGCYRGVSIIWNEMRGLKCQKHMASHHLGKLSPAGGWMCCHTPHPPLRYEFTQVLFVVLVRLCHTRTMGSKWHGICPNINQQAENINKQIDMSTNRYSKRPRHSGFSTSKGPSHIHFNGLNCIIIVYHISPRGMVIPV